MSYFPSSADHARERDATNRDLADRLRVDVLSGIIRRAIREIEAVTEIEHPDARYSVAELADILHGELNNLGDIASLLRGPLVLSEED